MVVVAALLNSVSRVANSLGKAPLACREDSCHCSNHSRRADVVRVKQMVISQPPRQDFRRSLLRHGEVED